jgi:high-affinity iron transporter
MLGFVLLVMVGEQIEEMQLANWISTTPMPFHFPDWAGLWFSLFNNWETVIAQVIAFLFVAGSYFVAERSKSRSRRSASRTKSRPSKSVELDSASK